jgi:hypothetical protein
MRGATRPQPGAGPRVVLFEEEESRLSIRDTYVYVLIIYRVCVVPPTAHLKPPGSQQR